MQKFQEILNQLPEIKILYVEDEDLTRELTYSILSQFFKNITVCQNGEEALKEFEKKHYDIVISDINMPKLNGLEFAKKIRKKDIEVSILFTTAHSDISYLSEALNIGVVDGFLIKPVDLKQLTSVLKRVLLKYLYQKQAKELQNYLKQFEEAVNESAIISKTDTKGKITYVNENFLKISKYSKKELIGKPHNIVFHPDMPKEIFKNLWDTIQNGKTFNGFIKNRDKEGKSYYVKNVIKPIVDLNGNIKEYLAIREEVTNIMNPKKMFFDALNGRDDILIYMKLQNYDEIEEFYPFEILEKIEQKSLDYLYKVFNKNFSIKEIFSLGNGEFALFLDKKYLTDKLVEKLKKIQNSIHLYSFSIRDDIKYDIDILMSIVGEGDYIYESAKLGLKQLIKEHKKFIIANNLSKVYQEKSQKNIQTIHLIQKAIKDSRIISYYQGLVNNKTKKIEKYESLVRLIDENGKVLSPFFFLETAKKSDYYNCITKIVLSNSFETLKKIKEDISINLSFLDIESEFIRNEIYNLLKTNKEQANRIVFELLEDESVKNIELVKEFVNEVKEYGVKIAIDDFGSGYSNFIRLLEFKPDILKIDGSLIKDIETNDFSLSIVKSIVTFAKENNLQTVAEFVENENIANIITDLGIDYSQGYFYAKPEPL